MPKAFGRWVAQLLPHCPLRAGSQGLQSAWPSAWEPLPWPVLSSRGRERQLHLPGAGSPTPCHPSPGPMAAFPPAHSPALPRKTAARVIAMDAKAQKGRSPLSVPRVRVALLPPHSSGADPAEYGREVLCGGRGKPLPGPARRPPQAAPSPGRLSRLPPARPARPPELPEEAAAVGVGRRPLC